MTVPAINNPFVGLRPFESDEDFLFFGREEQSLELLQRLHQHHFVAVIGSSGSGKSSLIKAGLIPGLEAGYLVNDRDRWLITSMKPGEDPLCNLAAAILEQAKDIAGNLTPTGLVEKINEEGVDALLTILKPLIEQKVNFFLLVDQFEELFRFSLDQKSVEKKDEATDFVNILLQLSGQMDLPIYVVITMRSDFIGDCTRFFGLPEALNKSQYLVPRINRTQLKTTIESPVRLYKGNINAGLTARLLNDAQLVKDELPLLQHALMRTWDYEVNTDKSGELDINDYEKIGGIEKALSNHADEALVGMSDTELLLTKKIFQALTTVDESGRKVRRPARISELAAITGAAKEQLLTIINRFIEGNRSFLVINKSGAGDDWLIDISHESLIRQWDTLSAWVDEEAESAKVYERLIESANLFLQKKKDLMTGSELQLMLNWYNDFRPVLLWAQRYNPAFKESIAYMKASEKESKAGKRRKKARKRNQLLLIFAFIAFVIIALAFYSKDKARQADIANKLKDSANRQKEFAILSLENAEKSKLEAEKQQKNAEISTLKAIEATHAAQEAYKEVEKQKNAAVHLGKIALAAENKASINAQMAKKEKDSAEIQKEGFRLILVARQEVNENPTVALRIAEEAYKKYPDSLILNEAKQIYEQNTFYKTVLKDSSSFSSITSSSNGTKVLATSIVLWPEDNRYYGLKATVFNPEKKAKQSSIFRYDGYSPNAFSPDGTKILIASKDSLGLWNVDGSRIMGIGDQSSIKAMAISHDGNKVLTTDGISTILRVIDGKIIPMFRDTTVVQSVAFSPDDLKVAVFSDSAFTLWNIDGKNGELFNAHHKISDPVFSPDNTKILTHFVTHDSLRVELWDISGGRDDSSKTHSLVLNHPGNITSMVFSDDGSKILTGSSKNTVKLWDLKDSLANTEFKGHTSPVTALAFSPDKREIMSGSQDGTAIVWKIDGTPLSVLKGHTDQVTYVAFSPDDAGYLTGSYDGVRAWNNSRIALEGHIGQINLVSFSADRRRILTGSEDHTAKLWNVQGDTIKTFIHDNAVASVAFSPDGKKILLAAGDTAFLLNKDFVTEKKLVHSGLVQSVVFSKDGTKILTGSDDSTARVWNLDGEELKKFEHAKGVAIAVFSPDGTKILTGSRDSSARLWNLNGINNQQPTIFKHQGIVYSVAFAPDSAQILTGSEDNTARLWKLDGSPIFTFKHNNQVESVAFSPDGKKILTGSHDHTVKLWKKDGTLLNTFGFPDQVRSVAFAPDGKKIVVGVADGIGRILSVVPVKEFLNNNEIDPLSPQQKKDAGIK